ncbi:MAG: tetratricopeptide repeat protein [Sedimentisphaerales bacterium]
MAESLNIKDHPKINYLRQFWICAVLTLATTAVYYRVCTYDFVNYDDNVYVYKNPNIQAGITLKNIKWAFTAGYASNWHPLTWLSLMLDRQLFGPDASGFHFTNLIFHIANTLLLFIVLKLMTNAIWQSAFVAALFVLHPLHVESVAWVSERKDVLSTFFWLLTMWAYVRYAGRGKISNYLLVVIFFVFGLLSKPMVVTLPFVLLLLDYWPLQRLNTKRSLPHLLIEKIPLFVIAATSCIITLIVQRESKAVMNLAEFPLKIRIYNTFSSYIQYIIKMIWPAKLAMFYPHFGQNVSILFIVISALILAAVTIFVLLFSKNHRYLGTGWFWYLGTLVPVIGIVQVGSQAMADRYTYITLTGLFIIIVWGISELSEKWPYRKNVLWASSLIVLSVLAVCSFIQQGYWKNTITLCEHALKVTDNNFQAHFSLAGKLIEEGRIEEAIRHSGEAVRIVPDYVEPIITLANALQMSGRIDEAIHYYERALKIAPGSADVYLNYGYALAAKGKFDDAISLYNKGLQIAPDSIELHINLGTALARSGRLDEAVKEYQKSLQMKPDNPEVLESLGIILFQQGKTDEAFKYFTETLRIDPNRPQGHYYLGQILAQRGKIDDAIEHFDDALRLKPTVKFMNVLAAAYAAAGNFNKAIEITEKALELCRSPEQKTVKEELEKRLTLYKAGKPYIEK